MAAVVLSWFSVFYSSVSVAVSPVGAELLLVDYEAVDANECRSLLLKKVVKVKLFPVPVYFLLLIFLCVFQIKYHIQEIQPLS